MTFSKEIIIRTNSDELVDHGVVLDALALGFAQQIKTNVDAVAQKEVELGLEVGYAGRGRELGRAHLLQKRGAGRDKEK